MPTTTPTPPQPGHQLDAFIHALYAQANNGLSPISNALATLDWASHLALSPGRQADLWRLAVIQAGDLGRAWLAGAPAEVPADRRFADPAWNAWPFHLLRDTFLLNERWWDAATHGVWGVEPHHEAQVAFGVRQALDVLSPGNFAGTNPVVIQRTVEEGGTNLLRGTMHAAHDALRQVRHEPSPEAQRFVLGQDVAATPGKVVLRNELIELIQYTPTTAKVHPEPVLIVPAWIMKYYILDLSQPNSLVHYLVSQGHTVFCVSWKNPERPDAKLSMDDYVNLGVMAALDEVARIVPGRPIHATGYCLGGTLLTIAAAALARRGDERIASLTLFAAQTDFTEPGELGLFIDEDQVSLLEALMGRNGVLRGRQMAGAFQMLRSNDLIWSRIINDYMLGNDEPMNELMAWNADTTRMPARMHSQYLRRLYLGNDLAEGRYRVADQSLSLEDLRMPIFVVGTVTDHVAPWHSVFKLHHLCAAELTFVLTSGGHNAGIVSPPGHPHRSYQLLCRAAGQNSMSADEWQQRAPRHEGSWWPAWQQWLAQRSDPLVRPPRMGGADGHIVCDAPGTYVLQK